MKRDTHIELMLNILNTDSELAPKAYALLMRYREFGLATAAAPFTPEQKKDLIDAARESLRGSLAHLIEPLGVQSSAEASAEASADQTTTPNQES